MVFPPQFFCFHSVPTYVESYDFYHTDSLFIYCKRFMLKNLAKSAPPLRFNIHVPSSRNVLLFCTPSFFLLYYAPILAVNLT